MSRSHTSKYNCACTMFVKCFRPSSDIKLNKTTKVTSNDVLSERHDSAPDGLWGLYMTKSDFDVVRRKHFVNYRLQRSVFHKTRQPVQCHITQMDFVKIAHRQPQRFLRVT